LLPATKTTTGVVGRAVEVGEFVLTKAARIEGVVRWSDGQPAAKVEVGICPRGENRVLALGAGASVQQLLDHTWAPIATAHSDEDGHFALPTAAGALFTLVVCAVPEHLLHGFVGVERLVAPRAADVTLPLPVRIRAVDDGAVVRDAEFLLGDARHRASDREELRVIVGSPDRHGAATVAARAGALRSATATLSSELAGTVLDLPLRRELAAVAIEFTGEFRVRNARFTFAPLDAGEPADERGLRDDRSGPFTCWLVPGRYRVYVRPSGGERNGVFLLEQSREFDLPAAGTSLTLPALFGGQLAIEVVDEHGIGIGGQCRVHDSAGQECTGYFRFLGATRMLGIGDTQRSGLKGQLCPRGFSELLRILPPGDYDLELDLGAHGIHRSRATITPRETTTVRVRVP